MSRYVRPSGDAPEYTDVLKAEIERLTAELAEAQKDVERFAWVLSQGEEFSLSLIIDAPGDGDYFCNGAFSQGQGATARAAIDAAMEAKP